jgi:hypothetical protein
VNSSLIIFLFIVFLISLHTNYALAQTTYTINMPTGAASPDAPYFWQSEKDGSTNGEITIAISDSVNWENADTAAHTVTSGTAKDGPDGKFDSSLMSPGASFIHQFTEAGNYPYFCLVHPWMTGTVFITSAMQVVPNVGADVGDGKTTFDLEYDFNRVVASVRVDQDQKSITVEIVGKPKSEDNTLTLMLPKALINGPYIIWADGRQITDFQMSDEGGINEVKIPLNSNSERVTITGTMVIPEFGSIAMAILATGVFGIIMISLKTQKFFRPNVSSL